MMSTMPAIIDPGRIHSLPGTLASQIAAGEVIERPASVVKELVENCLDAGAGRIQIDIEAAGSRLVRVRDDGAGIHPDDLSLAIAPHSTSKIHSVEDLAAIMSLGFRGEALASIAAVSKLRISSRHAGQQAHEITAEPGKPVPEPAPASHPAGTSIEVRDLFFNMPARRKFLRTEQTEFLHILELVKSLSLSRPQLAVRLTHNGRNVFSISAGIDMADRIGRIFGSNFAAAACTVDETAGPMRLHGVAGHSEAARSQADRQYVFLNGRLIRDRRLNHAMRTAYHDYLPAGRYAPFLLYLEMDPAEYDINVHPTKHEVRFRAGRDVHDFVYSALRRSLEANQPLADWQPGTDSRQNTTIQRGMNIAEPSAAGYQVTAGIHEIPADTDTREPSLFGSLLGCVIDRYLLVARDDAFTVIDGRRALAQLTCLDLQQEQALPSRPLLLPETQSVTTDQIARLDRTRHVLSALGIELDQSSPTQVMLRTLPSALPAIDTRLLLTEIVDCLTAHAGDTDLQQQLITILAEHAGRQFDSSTSSQLLQRLESAVKHDRLQRPWPWKTLDAAGLADWLDRHD